LDWAEASRRLLYGAPGKCSRGGRAAARH
jgi:hypothetical protein